MSTRTIEEVLIPIPGQAFKTGNAAQNTTRTYTNGVHSFEKVLKKKWDRRQGIPCQYSHGGWYRLVGKIFEEIIPTATDNNCIYKPSWAFMNI